MLVEFKNITKDLPLKENAFGAKQMVTVIDDVSFSLKDGTTFAIAGESGCGKTTIARLAANIIKPTSGEVLYEGKDVNRLIEYSFQEHAARKSAPCSVGDIL